MPKTLVTSYINPDLDGVACAVAYTELLHDQGKVVELGIVGTMHHEAEYMFERFGFTHPPSIQDTKAYDQIILVDTSQINDLADKIEAEKVIEIVDHRKVHNLDKFPNAKAHMELVGAAATLIAEMFIEQHAEISQKSATLLYSAIISNTQNFKGSVTTHRDRKAAEWLNAVAKLPYGFWKELFKAKSDLSGEKLKERIEGDFAWFDLGGKKVGIAQIEMIGAEKLIKERGEEIINALNVLKEGKGLDFIFQNTLELEEQKTYFVTQHKETQHLLEKVFSVQFSGESATYTGLIMRKQVVPRIKEYLDSLVY